MCCCWCAGVFFFLCVCVFTFLKFSVFFVSSNTSKSSSQIHLTQPKSNCVVSLFSSADNHHHHHRHQIKSNIIKSPPPPAPQNHQQYQQQRLLLQLLHHPKRSHGFQIFICTHSVASSSNSSVLFRASSNNIT